MGQDHYQKLKHIFEHSNSLLREIKPDEQAAFSLKNMFSLNELRKELDATDAIALAVCNYLKMRNPKTKSRIKNWGDFVKKNPGRVK